jgi:RNA polymerase sigma factor (TIGR02999 family)
MKSGVYRELLRIARGRIAAEYRHPGISPDGLVHETWLRLGGDKQPVWGDRRELLAAATVTMRRILVDRGRHRRSERFGGSWYPADLEGNLESLPDHDFPFQENEQIRRLREGLEQLEQSHPLTGELIRLRFFGGLTMKESARRLGMSLRTAERRLRFARSYLRRIVS